MQISLAQSNENSSLPSKRFARWVDLSNRLKQRSKIAGKTLALPERLAKKLLKPQPFQESGSKFKLVDGDMLMILADWHSSDTMFVDYLAKLRGVRLLLICYDLLPIVAPQYSGHATEYLSHYVSQIYPKADLVLAISRNTKKDVKSYLKQQKLRLPPIAVIRLGDDFKLAEPVKPSNDMLPIAGDGDFLLCVGTIEARKNHTLLYYTYKLARQRGQALPPLVVVGRRGWLTNDIYEMMTTDPDTCKSFHFLHNASDEELAWLYSHCRFSIYPSFYEGWGLPIAESIAYGAVCIASNTSSMPEVAGKLIDYFSPNSADECLATITRLLDKVALDKARSKIKQYQPTTWDETFKQVQAQIKKLNG